MFYCLHHHLIAADTFAETQSIKTGANKEKKRLCLSFEINGQVMIWLHRMQQQQQHLNGEWEANLVSSDHGFRFDLLPAIVSGRPQLAGIISCS